jgi:hypothetical protein
MSNLKAVIAALLMVGLFFVAFPLQFVAIPLHWLVNKLYAKIEQLGKWGQS